MKFPRTQRIVFFGTPTFAIHTLQAIADSGRNVTAVVTQPDKPGGRGQKMLPPPVKTLAVRLGIRVLQPAKLRTKYFTNILREQNADIFVVAAYGRILSESLISMPKYILNVHASLLPRWRGAAPIARAIEAGDAQAGVSIMKIVQRLDAGDYMLQSKIPIGEFENTGQLTERMAALGARSMVEALDIIDRGEEVFHPQDESLVTYAKPVEKDEARIIWNRPSKELHNHIRAMQPMPGAYTMDGVSRMKVHATKLVGGTHKILPPGTLYAEGSRLFVHTADGVLEMLEIQREAKSRQTAAIFLQGNPVEGKQWR